MRHCSMKTPKDNFFVLPQTLVSNLLDRARSREVCKRCFNAFALVWHTQKKKTIFIKLFKHGARHVRVDGRTTT